MPRLLVSKWRPAQCTPLPKKLNKGPKNTPNSLIFAWKSSGLKFWTNIMPDLQKPGWVRRSKHSQIAWTMVGHDQTLNLTSGETSWTFWAHQKWPGGPGMAPKIAAWISCGGPTWRFKMILRHFLVPPAKIGLTAKVKRVYLNIPECYLD